jgi:hypothetical protein
MALAHGKLPIHVRKTFARFSRLPLEVRRFPKAVDGASTFGDRGSVVSEGKMIIGTSNEIDCGASVVLATDGHVHSHKKNVSNTSLSKHANPIADVDCHAQMLGECAQAIWSVTAPTNIQLELETPSLPQLFQREYLRMS